MRLFRAIVSLLILTGSASALAAQRSFPPFPDTTGWGVHVLAAERAPDGSTWVGTYGRGMYRIRAGDSSWTHIESDTTPGSISWDFVHAFGFGPRGEIWYGTVGNGWGVSLDSGRTWKNWTFDQLGPEWQYVAPRGIVTRGDTTYIGTADGIQVTIDNGLHWIALIDSVGPAARGPADTAIPLLANEYVIALSQARQGVSVITPRGASDIRVIGGRWRAFDRRTGTTPRDYSSAVLGRCTLTRATECEALRRLARPRLTGGTSTGVRAPAPLRTTWFGRPINPEDNSFIDQTYRYGSTMGGNFQQHQGVEFNNPDGTPVHAIGSGTVVYAGRAERGALTVAIRHDTTVTTPTGRHHIFSVYYHNSELVARIGERVKAGDLLSRVGHTGRATNDHLHLEVHASPTDSVTAVVDSLNRFPSYTTNPELWIQPLPGTGVVAGQVFDSEGRPLPQARIYGLIKAGPRETPFSFAESYGDRAHPHPLYGEHFAVGDVPAGDYVVGVEIQGKKELRRIVVQSGKITWIEFRPTRR